MMLLILYLVISLKPSTKEIMNQLCCPVLLDIPCASLYMSMYGWVYMLMKYEIEFLGNINFCVKARACVHTTESKTKEEEEEKKNLPVK